MIQCVIVLRGIKPNCFHDFFFEEARYGSDLLFQSVKKQYNLIFFGEYLNAFYRYHAPLII
jgi:hypothetical protein